MISKVRHQLFTLTICLFAMPIPALSQTAPPRVLTLEDAIQLAMRQNPELTAARLEVEKADARVREAWGYALPVLSLQGQYQRSLKKPVFFLPDFDNPNSGRTVPIQIGSDHSINMTLSAQQVIFNSSVITGVGAASIYSEAAREIYRAKQLETVTNVRKAYNSVLLASEVQDMMRANLKNAEENLQNVLLLSKQGLVSEYDLLRAQVGVENLRPSVIQTENNYSLSLDGLRAVIGLGISESFIISGSLKFEPMDDAILASATEDVLKANPSLQAMRHQVEVNKAFVDVERSSYLPTVAAFGNYQYQLAKNNLNISTGDFIGSSIVGLNFSVNLFQGLQTRARVEQAQLEVRKTEEQLGGMETNLRTAAHSYVLKLRQTRQRIEAQRMTVQQAEKGYRIATTRFLNGAGTQLEVNDAQLALTQAKVNRIQAVYDYLVASAEFDQTLGRLPVYVNTNVD